MSYNIIYIYIKRLRAEAEEEGERLMALFGISLTVLYHSLSFFSPFCVFVSVSVNGFEGMVQQGLTEDEAKAMFYLVDENGLLSQVR